VQHREYVQQNVSYATTAALLHMFSHIAAVVAYVHVQHREQVEQIVSYATAAALLQQFSHLAAAVA